MPEIGTSGSMSGDGKRSVAEWLKLPRPSSTLPNAIADPIELRLSLEAKRKTSTKRRETDKE
jgi:hypothetical protein